VQLRADGQGTTPFPESIQAQDCKSKAQSDPHRERERRGREGVLPKRTTLDRKW